MDGLIKMFLGLGLVFLLTAGASAFPGKSHSGGKDDPVLQYVVNNSLRENPVLTKLRQKTLEDPWSIMMVASEQAQLMANLLKLINANKTIEIGMYTGYNALSMALVLPENGRVVACEIDDLYVDIAKPFFKEARVEDKIDVRLQTAIKTLDELLKAGEAGTYDFVFIDADKSNYNRYYEKSLELLRVGGIIAIDNVLWSGKVVDPAPDDLVSKTLDALNKKLHKDERIDLSMLTVGDGLTLAIKR
ncbi:catechol O-methyltransferase domain-containing protein 1-like isoform X1 [Osmerus mordax]|uniref:catechol O-methyltransferase domain-containing protein 1-like isoform X1 n=1 Tax=Osmerus mordax TaxID=8014 RepID=UPI00350FDA87